MKWTRSLYLRAGWSYLFGWLPLWLQGVVVLMIVVWLANLVYFGAMGFAWICQPMFNGPVV
jgi:hypothetical protein